MGGLLYVVEYRHEKRTLKRFMTNERGKKKPRCNILVMIWQQLGAQQV
jgi:hypothetical protein